MKNSKEMAEEVFRIRDTYLERRRRKITLAKRTAAVAVPCIAVMTAVILAAHSGQSIATRDELPNSSALTVSTVNEVQTTLTEVQTDETSSAAETSAVATTITEYETEQLPESIVPEEAPKTEMPDVAEGAAPVMNEPNVTEAPAENEPAVTEAAEEQPDEAPSEAVPEPAEEVLTEEADTDGLPAFSEEEIDALFPVIDLDRRYVCEGRAISRELLGEPLAETVLYSGDVSAEVTVYSLAGSEDDILIAVTFNGGEPILYGTKDDIQ